MLVALSLLLPALTGAVVVTPLGPGGLRVQDAVITRPLLLPPLLGGSEQTLSQPRRLRSLHCPLEVLVLHSEGLRHVLPSEGVPALLVILPPHPERLDAAPLARLGQAATCCAPQVKGRRGVRSEACFKCSEIIIYCLFFLDDIK